METDHIQQMKHLADVSVTQSFFGSLCFLRTNRLFTIRGGIVYEVAQQQTTCDSVIMYCLLIHFGGGLDCQS